jgi:hypothetical protein
MGKKNGNPFLLPGEDPVLAELRAMVLPSTSRTAMGLDAAARDLSGPTVGDALKNFISQLAQALDRLAHDVTSLEVCTYTSEDLDQVRYDPTTGRFSGPTNARVVTRIAFDGDIQAVVPHKEGELNESLWVLHLAMVREAQNHRAQFLSSMADLAAKIIGMFGRR